MSFLVLPPVRLARGFFRAGYIEGTTKIVGDPDIPASRVVQLFERESPAQVASGVGRPLARMISSESGEWRFDECRPDVRYAVIAYDHTGVHDPVIKLNLIPTVD